MEKVAVKGRRRRRKRVKKDIGVTDIVTEFLLNVCVNVWLLGLGY
jgi:hypothetical protein